MIDEMQDTIDAQANQLEEKESVIDAQVNQLEETRRKIEELKKRLAADGNAEK